MKLNSKAIPQLYLKTLQKHLKEGLRASLAPALRLGHEAVNLGVRTLELARMHEKALTVLEISADTPAMFKRAENFFAEANTSIVETQHAAKKSKQDLNRLNKSLDHCATELVVTNLRLKQGNVRRKDVEAALKKSDGHNTTLLKESLQLQRKLRQLTHHVLTAQENERRHISRKLQEEILQTLLGINVRLLTLRQEAKSNSKGLKNEIASAQRMVATSGKTAKQAARELYNNS